MTASSDSESDGRSAVLAAFAGALRRETHVLQEQPDLLWQQNVALFLIVTLKE
jgi:hypothetical protein